MRATFYVFAVLAAIIVSLSSTQAATGQEPADSAVVLERLEAVIADTSDDYYAIYELKPEDNYAGHRRKSSFIGLATFVEAFNRHAPDISDTERQRYRELIEGFIRENLEAAALEALEDTVGYQNPKFASEALDHLDLIVSFSPDLDDAGMRRRLGEAKTEYEAYQKLTAEEKALFLQEKEQKSLDGRMELLFGKRNDVFDVLGHPLRIQFRAMSYGDEEVLRRSRVDTFGSASRSAYGDDLGGLSKMFLFKEIQKSDDNGHAILYSGPMAVYAMVRSDILGSCGDRMADFGASSQIVTRYVNGFGVQRGVSVGQLESWTFSVPHKFAGIVRDANILKVPPQVAPELQALVNAFDGCADPRRKRLEQNMLAIYNAMPDALPTVDQIFAEIRPAPQKTSTAGTGRIREVLKIVLEERPGLVAISDDGRKIAVEVDLPDSVVGVAVYDDTGSLLHRFPCLGPRGLHSLEFSPDGASILTAENEGAALWTLEGVQKTRFEGPTRHVRSAAFSNDGSKVAVTSRDGTVRVFAPSGNQLMVSENQHGYVIDAAFDSSDSRVVSVANNFYRVFRLDSESESVGGFNKPVSPIRKLEWLDQTGEFLVYDAYERLERFSAADGRHLGTVATDVVDFDRTSDDNRIVVAQKRGKAAIYTLAGEREERFIDFPSGPRYTDVYHIDFSRQSARLVTSARLVDEYRVKIWSFD